MPSIKGFMQSVNDWIDWQESHRSREELGGIVMGGMLVIVALAWAMGW